MNTFLYDPEILAQYPKIEMVLDNQQDKKKTPKNKDRKESSAEKKTTKKNVGSLTPGSIEQEDPKAAKKKGQGAFSGAALKMNL